MNKDYGLLDLRYLASYYGTLLGSSYRVELNSLEYPERREGITVVTVQAERVPFAVENVNAETLRVQLNFRLNTKRKAIVLADIAKLLGSRNFEIETYRENESGEETADKAFTLYSFLDMPSPLNSPEVDTGAIMVTYEVRGTILVTQKGCGAVVSNAIVTELSTQPIDGAIANERRIAVLSCQVTNAKSLEPYVETDCVRMKTVEKARSCAYAISAICLGNSIDRKLCEDIEILGEGGEQIYYVRRTYPSGAVVTKRCLLTEGTLLEQAGAYSQIAITLQEV